jgi:hypothetical protein
MTGDISCHKGLHLTGKKLFMLLLLTGRVMQAKFCLDVVCVVCPTEHYLFALRCALGVPTCIARVLQPTYVLGQYRWL